MWYKIEELEFELCPQGEVEALTRKMESDKTEHTVKLEHSAKLLDSRAAKIRKLQGAVFRLQTQQFVWLHRETQTQI